MDMNLDSIEIQLHRSGLDVRCSQTENIGYDICASPFSPPLLLFLIFILLLTLPLEPAPPSGSILSRISPIKHLSPVLENFSHPLQQK
jgi:hypothetical protein